MRSIFVYFFNSSILYGKIATATTNRWGSLLKRLELIGFSIRSEVPESKYAAIKNAIESCRQRMFDLGADYWSCMLITVNDNAALTCGRFSCSVNVFVTH